MVGRRGAGRVRPRPAPAFSPSLTSLPLISILFPEDAALPVLVVRANAMLTLWILLPMACAAPDFATQVFCTQTDFKTWRSSYRKFMILQIFH